MSRELHVAGFDAESNSVVFEDQSSGEQFSVSADDTLRAAARGDVSRVKPRLGAAAISLRPREIQARVRAGASLTEISREAGVPEARIEAYVHPVLLERQRIAEIARNARPILPDGPATFTVEVATARAVRLAGADDRELAWDAWRARDGFWVLQARWEAQGQATTAHWQFTRGTNGGTAAPMDDPAVRIGSPEAAQSRRGLAAVTSIASHPGSVHDTNPASPPALPDYGLQHPHPSAAQPPAEVRPVASSGGTAPPTGTRSAAAVAPAGQPAAARPAPGDGDGQGGDGRDAKGKRARKRSPAMPSWDEVLLGVRSPNED